MSSHKNSQEQNQNSLIFEYPFLMSSIKKPLKPQNITVLEKQITYKMNFPVASPISESLKQQNTSRNPNYSPESNIDDDSSIEFYEDQEEFDETTKKQIQELEKEITFKLNQQYILLKEKLKIKSKVREHVLRNFRQTCTAKPLQEKSLAENNYKNVQPSKKQGKPIKNNPLNTQTIKNRIIRKIQESQNIQFLKNGFQFTKIDEFPSMRTSSNQSSIFNHTFKIQNLSNVEEEPSLLKRIQHKQVQSITNIDSSDVIRQMSEELKKMEFNKVEDIARGKFTFLRKKR